MYVKTLAVLTYATGNDHIISYVLIWKTLITFEIFVCVYCIDWALKILHSIITCRSCVSVEIDICAYMCTAIFHKYSITATDLMLGRCFPESLFLSGKVLLYSFQMAL